MATTTPNKEVPKITLHWLELSRSHRVLWLLEELQIPYNLKTYKRLPDRKADPALKDVQQLGKSPILSVERPGQDDLVLIESANIMEYLCGYYGQSLVPKRYVDGKEGQIGMETEGWLRYRTYMHYAEGSLMPLNLIALIAGMVKGESQAGGKKIWDWFLHPNYMTHYAFLEDQLKTSPDNGKYLCGKEITVADMLMSYPVISGQSRSGLDKSLFPKLFEYADLLQQSESWKRSVRKIEEVEGHFQTHIQ